MTQDADNASWSISPWAGTLDQVVRAAQHAADRVAEEVPPPAGYGEDSGRYDAEKHEQLRGAERARTLQIDVVERDGFSRSLNALGDLEEFPDEDLDKIKRLHIEIGGKGFLPVSAGFEFDGDGLHMRLSGRTRTWTAGLRHELSEILIPKTRLRPHGLASGDGELAAEMGAVWTSALIASGVLLKDATNLSWGVRVPLGFVVPTLLVVFLGVVGFGLPRMELLPVGATPRYQRWKSRIVSAATALIIGIAASFIVALTQ